MVLSGGFLAFLRAHRIGEFIMILKVKCLRKWKFLLNFRIDDRRFRDKITRVARRFLLNLR